MSGRGNFKTSSSSNAGGRGCNPATAKKVSTARSAHLAPHVGGISGASNQRVSSNVSSFDAEVMELLGERFVAYNENLLSVAANQIKQREKTDLENSIQSQLNAISHRLVTDQQIVSDLEKRLSDVKLMSATSEKLDKQEAQFTAKLKDIEVATKHAEKIAVAVEPNLHYLRTRNLDLGPGIDSLKNALTTTVKLLDGMNTEPSDVKNVAETAENLASVNRDVKDLDEEIEKLHTMVPGCERAVVTASALKM